MKTAILLLLCIATAHADSVETSNKVTIYGRVVQMDQNEITLVTSFPSNGGVASKEVKVPRIQVVKIEFNSSTFNPGGPPGIGARPSAGGVTTSPTGQDFAVLVDGHRQLCNGATIDIHQSLHCDKQDFLKGTVIRIFLATK